MVLAHFLEADLSLRIRLWSGVNASAHHFSTDEKRPLRGVSSLSERQSVAARDMAPLLP
jgi:hypothetical protein